MSSVERDRTEVAEAVRSAQGGKYLTFFLGEEEYGVEILTVREIISVLEITALPTMPDYVKGVINLRGSVIPVIDLREKFGMPHKEYDDETCTIVVNLNDYYIGIIVDRVSEVMDINGEEIDPPPKFGTSVHTEFMTGIGKTKERVVVLLDIEKVLTEEKAAFEAVA